jgi:DNA modification methylase
VPIVSALRNSVTVQRRPLDTLRLPAWSVRTLPKSQIEKAKNLFAAHGQIPLVYASSDGEIIHGAEIWLAMKDTPGAAEIDTVVLHGKSPGELKAISLALHRIPEDGRWDPENVRLVLEELDDLNFDLTLTGFDVPEIDNYLNLDFPPTNVEENGSDLPPLQADAVSTAGDVWELAEQHRLGCGNATDLEFVRSVVGERQADVSFIDVPYNVPIAGFVSGNGRRQHRELIQGTGELSDERYGLLLQNALAVLQQILTSNALIYSCIDWRHVLQMLAAGRACGMSLYQIAVWVKSNGGLGGIYRNQHEMICIFKSGDGQPLDNVELGKRGRNRTNVWSYPGMSSFGKDRERLLGLHPTVKPVAMIADALRDVTKRGDIVIDTFSGSGSTLMAAEETGRLFRGVELDPLYVDVGIRRWQTATGRTAVLLRTGESFDDLERRLATSGAPNHAE